MIEMLRNMNQRMFLPSFQPCGNSHLRQQAVRHRQENQ